MKDREYDLAVEEIKFRNDELERKWLLHKMGRRAEVLLNGQKENQAERFQAQTNAYAPQA